MIVVGARRRVIGADAAILEAADHAGVALELVKDAQTIVAIGDDMAGAAADQADDIPFFVERMVVAAARREFRPIGVAAQTGKLTPTR